MKVSKFTNEKVIEFLNLASLPCDDTQIVTEEYRKKYDKLSDGLKLRHPCEEVYFSDAGWFDFDELEPGDIVEMVMKISAPSVKDLDHSDFKDLEAVFERTVHGMYDEALTVLCAFLAPDHMIYTEGDSVGVSDLFDLKNEKFVKMFNETKKLWLKTIKENPEMMKTNISGFFNVEKLQKFVMLDDRTWRVATPEDEVALEQRDNALLDAQKTALSKLTPLEIKALQTHGAIIPLYKEDSDV